MAHSPEQRHGDIDRLLAHVLADHEHAGKHGDDAHCNRQHAHLIMLPTTTAGNMIR